jgi:diamine N-acetyltransferase
MMGPPLFPDVEPPTWEEFSADYGPHFFDGSRPEIEASYVIEVGGEAIGQINYEIRDRPTRLAEIDIWLRSQADTGRGYGSDALVALIKHVSETHEVHRFLIRPSARNTRAIRAYQKAGFRVTPMNAARQAEVYGPGDYEDSVVLIRDDRD